jgi:hypothetical protein
MVNNRGIFITLATWSLVQFYDFPVRELDCSSSEASTEADHIKLFFSVESFPRRNKLVCLSLSRAYPGVATELYTMNLF